MSSYALYRGLSPSIGAAMNSIVSGDAIKSDAAVQQLGGLANATKLAEETRKLAMERKAEEDRLAALPALAAEHAASLAGTTVPRLNQYRQYIQSGNTGIPDEAGNINPWLGEGGSAPTPEATNLSRSLSDLTGILLGKQGPVTDYASAANTYKNTIPTAEASLPGIQAEGRTKTMLADALQNQIGATYLGDTKQATDWASIAHPELLKDPDKIATVQGLIDRGMDPKQAMETVFEPDAVRTLISTAQRLNKPLAEVFKQLHPGPQNINMYGAPMAVERVDPNTGEKTPTIIVPSKEHPGAYSVMPGVEPPSKPKSIQQIVGEEMQNSKKDADRLAESLRKEATKNPALRGLQVLGPSKTTPGAYLIGPPGGPAKYTWTPAE